VIASVLQLKIIITCKLSGILQRSVLDEFPILVLIFNKLFSNYKCASNQREAFNWQLICVSMFMLFERLIEIKN